MPNRRPATETCDRIEGAHANKQGTKHVRERHGERDADANAEQGESPAAGEHVADDVGAARAEGHSDAELPHLLADVVSNHSIQRD
jgi:hypothetical protein